MNVLSLFDGMSCGQIALQRAGIPVTNYYASEIDKYAIKVTMANYPNTIQLGSVVDVKAIDLPQIDLLIGGSPCQGFSFAGKQLAFDDPISKLFFEYVRLLKECKPKCFLLENVKMKKQFEQIITQILNCRPLRLNSALVSAQNRERLYWTNIPVLALPIDKGIMLKDITEDGANLVGRMVGRRINPVTGKRDDYNTDIDTVQRIEPRFDANSGALTTVQKDNLVIAYKFNRKTGLGNELIKSLPILSSDWRGLNRNQNQTCFISKDSIRALTPIECERLQTVPDNYTNHTSSTQRYKMLGNGWTVDVIAHIFSFLK